MYTVVSDVPAQPMADSASRVTVADMRSPVLLFQVWVGATSVDVVPSPNVQTKFWAPSSSGMVNTSGEHTESLVNAKLKVAAAKTSTLAEVVSLQPRAWVAIKVTGMTVSDPLDSKT